MNPPAVVRHLRPKIEAGEFKNADKTKELAPRNGILLAPFTYAADCQPGQDMAFP